MRRGFSGREFENESALATEAIVDIDTESPQPGERERQEKPGRRKLSDFDSGPTNESQEPNRSEMTEIEPDAPAPPTKPGRPRLTTTMQIEADLVEPPSPKPERPRLISQEAPLVAPEPHVKPPRTRLSGGEQQPATSDFQSLKDQPHLTELTLEPTQAPDAPDPQVHAAPETTREVIDQLRAAQNFPMAIGGGLLATVVGALLWAMVSAAASTQIGYMALGVGLLVGGAVRLFGHGLDKRFGYLAGGLALFGCVLGDLLTSCTIAAYGAQVSLVAVLVHISLADIAAAMIQGFHPLDILFFGIAMYEGYRLSFRRLAEARNAQATTQSGRT